MTTLSPVDRLTQFGSAALVLLLPLVMSAAETRDAIDGFLEQHCYDCHDDVTRKADLNLLDLALDLERPENLFQWADVLDRVVAGDMPPKDKKRPDAEALEAFVDTLQKPLLDADRERIAEWGRGRVRRLNRAEYETALSDLFQRPFDVRQELPEDARSHGFDTVGAALNVSSVQMQGYLDVLDRVFDQSTTLYERPERRKHRLTYLENNGIMQVYRRGGPYLVQDDGVAFFATEKFSHLNATLGQYTVPYSGRYKVKVSAYALRTEEPIIVSLRAGGTGHAESNHVPHVFLDHFSVGKEEPQVFEWEGTLERGHYFHVYPTSLRPFRFAGPREEGKQADYEGPAAVVQWVEVDGPIIDEWPPASHQRLWGDLRTEAIPEAKPNRDPNAHLLEPPANTAKPKMTRIPAQKETGNQWVYDPKQAAGGEPIHRNAGIPVPLHPIRRLVSADPKEDADRLLRAFADEAFRRPIAEGEVEPFIDLVLGWLNQGTEFEDAMRVGYKALLTSPAFLYHQGSLPSEGPSLSGPALAERLAFFLWNGAPDEALLEAGRSGELFEPKRLRVEVDRLLEDDRRERFLEHFLSQWLDLELIDFTVPDEKLYPEFDKLLQWSMVEETRAFVREMLEKDLGASHLVDSDFAMLNWRLARHYDLPSVDGMAVRRVELPKHSIRGGLMTQGSVLKVTANGTTTSPVVRGTWMLERIMGVTPDPPPPGVPAIEPDIRGATSIREQLELHRQGESCASCHAKIDPPGMALESFDVIGGFRENYRAINEQLLDLKPRYGPKAGPPIRYIEGPAVDASYEMADGRDFGGIEDFKQILLSDTRTLAGGLLEKLIVYSTGAEISPADREAMDTILDRAEPAGYGLRTLIHELVQSPLFKQK